jgi:hypothetical protein
MKIIDSSRLKKLEDEEWVFIPESDEKYMVSNYGRVKSFSFNKTDGQIMKHDFLKGYPLIKLVLQKKRSHWYIHKLVATVWLPEHSEEQCFVIHIDGNKKNNHPSNLSWATKEDVLEGIRKKPKPKNPKDLIKNSKLSVKDVALLKSMINRGIPNVQIAKLFCISDMQVTRIKRGENWGHVPALQSS